MSYLHVHSPMTQNHKLIKAYGKPSRYITFGAHPDDVELSCAGTILKEIASGKKLGLLI